MVPRNARRSAGRFAFDQLEGRTLFAAMVGLTSADELVTFDSATPATTSTPVAVTGLQSSETLLGIDFRPVTGQLFGLGSTGRLYTINVDTGAAAALGSATFTITGTNFGFDFNPQVDRIRIVSDADFDGRANPNTGTLVDADTVTGGQQNDGDLAFATGDGNASADPNIIGSAYSNNFSSTGSTTLYGIDTALDVLVTQGSGPGAATPVSPNTGQLFTVGALGVDFNNVGGFDIAESDGTAYAAFGTAGGGGGGGGGSPSTFYTIDLTTGAATAGGVIGSDLVLKGLTAVPVQQTLFVLASSGTAFAALDLSALGVNPTTTAITGLDGGDTIASLDFRPATGELFGATADGQLYTIDPATGAATAVGTGFNPVVTGNIIDIDFNPTVDRIRVLTDLDQNARANPDTGALVDTNSTTDGVQLDTQLLYDSNDAGNGTDPDVVAGAYTNSIAGTTTTTLYGIDAVRDVLVSIGTVAGVDPTVSPNTGRLFTVGSAALGVDVDTGGLDIANGGAAYAVINAVGGTGTQLYTINTTSGAATLIGTIGDGTQTFADIAVGATIFTITPATQTVAEDLSGGNVTLTVTRGGIADGAATVSYVATVPTTTSGNATAGSDFGTAGQTTFSGTASFADGETTKTITIPIIDDATTNEGNESFTIAISDPTVGELGAAASAVVTITEDDQVTAIAVADDPVRTGKTNDVLTITGTDADEEIIVTQNGASLVVTVNGTAVGTPTPRKGLYRIVVKAGGGDDIVRINSKVATPAEIHGEDGNDLLVGSKGKDLLIGGDGTDSLDGRSAEDILIGGISDYTSNPTATATLLNTFLGKGTFATRAAAVSTGTGVGGFIFSSETIDDDTDRDYLNGAGTADLILTNTKDAVADESPRGIVTALV